MEDKLEPDPPLSNSQPKDTGVVVLDSIQQNTGKDHFRTKSELNEGEMELEAQKPEKTSPQKSQQNKRTSLETSKSLPESQ